MPINLDAAAVRAELHDGPYTSTDQALIDTLDDATIDAAIRAAATDHFWYAYDTTRAAAITTLLRGPATHPPPATGN